MNNEDFRKEMHQYLDTVYDSFMDIQKEVTEIFQIFHQICKKNQIPYYVLYGSLIGLVRDGGFIPWDPDMDVALPIDALPALRKALRKDLPEEYYVVSEEDEDFPYIQLRVCKKGFSHDQVHLDVFYMVGAPEGEALEEYKTKMSGLFRKRIVYFYYQELKKRTDLNRMEKLTRAYYKLKVGSLSVAKLNKEYEELAHQYPYGQSKNVVCVAEEKISVERSLLDPPKYIETSLGEASVPHDEIKYLDATYKNYREYIPVQKRFREFYNFAEKYDQTAQQDLNYYTFDK